MSNLLSNIIESSGVLNQVDLIEIGCLDLKSGKIEISSFGDLANNGTEYYFDLASITKVLTNGLIGLFSKNQIDDNLKYCLEHSSGIPSWGLLSKSSWQSEIECFEIKKSENLYSDYGAIRACFYLKVYQVKTFILNVENSGIRTFFIGSRREISIGTW